MIINKVVQFLITKYFKHNKSTLPLRLNALRLYILGTIIYIGFYGILAAFLAYFLAIKDDKYYQQLPKFDENDYKKIRNGYSELDGYK